MTENNIEYRCQGNCIHTHGRHNQDVKLVYVFKSQEDWGVLFYCGFAVAEAKRKGFTVEELQG